MSSKPHIKELLKKRHDLIPGAAHTYSKGDDQFPANAPKAMLKGKGAYVWGDDGKKYLDWCMGLRSVSLGHGYSTVVKAVSKIIKDGTNYGRPHISEFALANKITKIIPYAEMVKFAKNGSTVTTAATKLSRAFTGRKYIAVCSSHPFFSYDDWFIGTTQCDAGIPEEIKQLTLTFKYNDIDSVEKLFAEHPKEIACVIMEVVTTDEPQNNFLQKVQDITKRNGAVFILDEMITGFRFDLQGATKLYGLKPDLITYGKGIANGFSLAVLAGRKDIMELGGLKHKKERVFLISTTHGAETSALAAASETIQEMKKKRIQQHYWKMGGKLRKGLADLIKKHGLSKNLDLIGFAPNLSLNFKDNSGTVSFVYKSIFLQEIIKRGILFQGYFAISFSHKEAEIKHTIKVFDEAMKTFKQIISTGNPEKYLLGEAVKPVFRKYN